MAPERRRIVFLDIDGTLTDALGRVPDSAVGAIRAARANGHLVMLATGRSPIEIDPALADIGFDGMIAGAGAYIELGGEWILERELTEQQVRHLIGVFDRLGLDYSLQGRRGVYPTAGHRARMRRVLKELGFTNLEDASVRLHITDPGEMRYDHAAKAVFDGDDVTAYAAVESLLGEEFTVVGGTLPGLGDRAGEVSPRGVHKAAAIEVVLERLGLSIDDAIAVGDSGNDVEMLLAVGTGIAMGGSTEAALAAADEVTDAVEDDGLAHAFARHGLV
ncbi:HAD family hydrolase [Microbacterium fluvii]|uniref:HAD family hydrolase n=1 Tax=Microbacterium fluvii TaxID=415215 RepID=A0ABW2HJE4_9MICO|nr:HAD family hydrolase [Microbacterium fluvii]MCU4673591.1 HAD family hydrolase [Microbacterium fluvii]